MWATARGGEGGRGGGRGVGGGGVEWSDLEKKKKSFLKSLCFFKKVKTLLRAEFLGLNSYCIL